MPEHYNLLLKTMMNAFLTMSKEDPALMPKQKDAVAAVAIRCMAVLVDTENSDG